MEIQILEKTDFTMQLIIRGVEVPFANALRRVMLSEVPVMAIDDVVIIENSSMLNDEILAHRLGLIPLKTDLDSYNLPEECPCKSEFGCNLCRTALTLEAEAIEETKTVYSEELQPENPDVTPVSAKIPITKLAPTQKIRLEAYARLGIGKDHAKWQPVSVCAYKFLPQIEIDEERCNMCGKCVEICPKNILTKSKEGLEVRNELECNLCQDCMNICPKDPPAIQTSWDKSTFLFNIESTGALPVERIVHEAIDSLDKRFKDFSNRLKATKNEAG